MDKDILNFTDEELSYIEDMANFYIDTPNISERDELIYYDIRRKCEKEMDKRGIKA